MKSKVDQVSLDINKISQSLRMRTEKLEPLSSACSIYTVPPHLRELNNEMYTPKIVSIGPFHHGKKELEVMEEHKERYLCAFLDRIKIEMEEYIEGLKELEISLRQSYAQINGCTREEFMEIMAVDGAFLMEYLLRYYYRSSEASDRIFGRHNLSANVKSDMLLLENQLPFFYLKYLFKLFQKSMIDCTVSLTIIVQHCLADASPLKWSVTIETVTEETVVCHLLHFLIICLRDSGRKIERGQCKNLSIPTISTLHQAGVKFKSSSSNCLFDINFSNDILEIPMLRLTDHSEMLFRNMQAFEYCHNIKGQVNDYISIMDKLINNEEDVKILVKKGIIDNWLGDYHAAATMFNNLGKGNCISSRSYVYASVIEDLNGYYKLRRHRWKATLKQKYFNNPWTIISVVAAAFLLLLTIIQTVCSILGLV